MKKHGGLFKLGETSSQGWYNKGYMKGKMCPLSKVCTREYSGVLMTATLFYLGNVFVAWKKCGALKKRNIYNIWSEHEMVLLICIMHFLLRGTACLMFQSWLRKLWRFELYIFWVKYQLILFHFEKLFFLF